MNPLLGRSLRETCTAIVLVCSCVPTAARAAEDPLTQAVAQIEQRAAQLVEENGGSPEAHCAHLVDEARESLGSEPHVAAAIFGIVLRQCPAAGRRTDVLLDAARAGVVIGTTATALQIFAEASRGTTAAHELAPAVEGFSVMADRVGRVDQLPPLEKYVQVVGARGRLDNAGYQAIYRLGRTLARQRDQRASTVLEMIPRDAAPGRKALYIRGALLLRDGNVPTARTLFSQAAELESRADHGPSDARTLELSWLAVGRLAFEVGDAEAGFYAYQQILVHSPQFATAFLELGWLAMETGNEDVALLAFEPLISLDAQGEEGRRAALLKGYVMLQRKEYDRAQAHYETVGRRYTTALHAFAQGVARIDDLADLARNCDAREEALRDPKLAPMMARLEIEEARRLESHLELVASQGQAGEALLEAVVELLAGQKRHNPLRALGRARKEAADALQQVNGLTIQIERTAQRASWTASLDPPPAEPGCCEEPRERLRAARSALESLLVSLDERQRVTRATLEAIRRDLTTSMADHAQRYARLKPEIQAKQRKLVEMAVVATKVELYHTAMEGDAGVLEAIWRFKEDHREQIRALEVQRKVEISDLENRFEEATLELYGES